MIGQTIAHYQVTGKLGAGGMGEVFRATDTKLGREVALKVLPAAFAGDAERMARFQREAQVLASLNHPNIAAIYGLEQNAIVMELVEGQTLAERISAGPLPLEEALPIARQIAEALEAAHDKGIVHRDLKPANVKVRPDGSVKVLDFGLAKALDDDPATSSVSNSPTLSMAATRAGVILGTAAYMSPEQAKGKPVDRRADIWAFGVVLLEMLTGRKVYGGETAPETLAAVMKDEPRWDLLPADTPAAIQRLLRRCLDKDPKRRLRDIGEARLLLEDPASLSLTPPVSPSPTPPLSPSPRPRLPWAVAVAGLAAAAALAVVHFGERPPDLHVVRFPVFPPPKVTFEVFDLPAISPDGQRLVFPGIGADGKKILWLRSLDSPAVQPLAGTEGASFPFWSPDSRYVAFFTNAERKLKKIDVSGGAPLALCDLKANGMGGAWNRDGTIVFASGSLYRISAAGGEAKPLLDLDKSRQEIRQIWPVFLPDHRRFVYLSRSSEIGKDAIYSGSLDSKQTRFVMQADSNARYSPPGFLLFTRQETLLAQPFDAGKVQVAGDPFPVAERVGPVQVMAGSLFSVSDNGVLAYRSTSGSELQLAWFNRDGKRLGSVGERGDYRQVVLSPDEKRLSVERTDSKTGTRDLWLLELGSGIFSRLTFHPENDQDAVWSPDSRALVFASSRKGRSDLYRKVIGGSDEEVVLESAESKFPEDWLKDGSVVFGSPIGGRFIYRLPLGAPSGPERKPVLLFQSEFNKDEPHVSPDSRWVAFNSNESGRWEVYAAAFPSFADKRQVSNAGGGGALWRKDGKELFYLTLDGKLMAVEVKAGTALETGAPRLLFQTTVRVAPTLDQYAVTGDGQRFLFGEPVEQGDKPVNVVLNWTAGVRLR